tara:strand:+ start:29165 stop:29542 length:378 start_codon:yes stop_codon:yes gene_type:complete
MQRRLFLSNILVALLVLTGCIESRSGDGVRSAPTSDRQAKELLRVENFDIDATPEGKLIVNTIIVNEGRNSRMGKLVIVVKVEGEIEQKTEIIEVKSNEKIETATVFEISLEEFEEEGELEMSIE